MWLAVLAPLASAATLHFETDAPVDVSVGDERVNVRAGDPADVAKVDGGTVRVEVRGAGGAVAWAGDLSLPHDAEVWLAWRQEGLVLVKAARLAGAEAASGATRAANTLMAIGAGAQAASDVAHAGSAASDDFAAAQRGEAVESSDTRMEVSAGPGGVQSSTSRTTAGEGGVHSESTATSLGPDGVSRDTSTADVTMGGASFEQDHDAVARIEIPGEDGPMVVSLVRVEVGAPPPGPAAPKPKSVWYVEPAVVDAGGARWTFLDPVAEADAFKLQVRVAVSGDRALVWEPEDASARFDGAAVASRGGKPLVVMPGGDDRHTLGFGSTEQDLRADAIELILGEASSLGRGPDLGLGGVQAVAGQSTSGGSVTCTVRSVVAGKKATTTVLDCANAGPEWAWLWPAAASSGLGDAAAMPNASQKQAPMLVAPGAEGKLSIDAPIGDKALGEQILRVDLGGVGLAAERRPVALAPVALTLDPVRTAEEN